jgi:transcriptional regulator with XRE-family HTH domain
MAGVSRGTVSHLENGRHGSPGAIQRIARALGVEPEALMTHPEDPAVPLELAVLRQRRALTLADVAMATKVSERVIARAERGGTINLARAKALSDFYGVRTTDWLPVDAA